MGVRKPSTLMPPAEYETRFAEAKRAYALAGKPAQTATKFHNAGHQVDNEAVFQWLNQQLNPPSKPGNQ